jgi:hypothetical protein
MTFEYYKAEKMRIIRHKVTHSEEGNNKEEMPLSPSPSSSSTNTFGERRGKNTLKKYPSWVYFVISFDQLPHLSPLQSRGGTLAIGLARLTKKSHISEIPINV